MEARCISPAAKFCSIPSFFFLVQLRVEADGSPQSVKFYARHGFIPSDEEATSEGQVLLAGDRGAALSAIKEIMVSGDGVREAPGAVVVNLMARLLHDAGNLEGAVNAYLKALEVRTYGTHTCLVQSSFQLR